MAPFIKYLVFNFFHILLYVVRDYLFPLPYHVLLCECTINLSTLLLMGIWVVSCLSSQNYPLHLLVRVKIYLGQYIPGSKFSGSQGSYMFSFSRQCKLFSKVVINIAFSFCFTPFLSSFSLTHTFCLSLIFFFQCLIINMQKIQSTTFEKLDSSK